MRCQVDSARNGRIPRNPMQKDGLICKNALRLQGDPNGKTYAHEENQYRKLQIWTSERLRFKYCPQ